jgi:hypothetical protein
LLRDFTSNGKCVSSEIPCRVIQELIWTHYFWGTDKGDEGESDKGEKGEEGDEGDEGDEGGGVRRVRRVRRVRKVTRVMKVTIMKQKAMKLQTQHILQTPSMTTTHHQPASGPYLQVQKPSKTRQSKATKSTSKR